MSHSTKHNEYMIAEGRTAGTALVSSDQVNPGFRGVVVFLNIDAIATGNLTLTIEGKSPVGTDEYYTLLTGAAISGTGLTTYTVYPAVTPAANVAVSDVLPPVWKVEVAVAGGGTRTYDVAFAYIP